MQIESLEIAKASYDRLKEAGRHRMEAKVAEHGIPNGSGDGWSSSVYLNQKFYRDKFKIVFLTFFLYGVATVLPWNILLSSKNVN